VLMHMTAVDLTGADGHGIFRLSVAAIPTIELPSAPYSQVKPAVGGFLDPALSTLIGDCEGLLSRAG
jgi:hypothetical protein